MRNTISFFLTGIFLVWVSASSFGKQFKVTNTSGTIYPGSLPWAIQQAKEYNRNNPPEPHQIIFDIPRNPLQTKDLTDITIIENLPFDLSGLHGLVISAPFGTNGMAKIYINANNKEGVFNLNSANNCTIKGLGFYNFRDYAILIQSSSQGNIIQRNVIGFHYHVGSSKYYTNKDYNRLTSNGIIVGSHHNRILDNYIAGVQHGIVVGAYPTPNPFNALMAGDNYILNNRIGPCWTIAEGYPTLRQGGTDVGILLKDGAGYNYVDDNILIWLNSHGIVLRGLSFSNHIFRNYIGWTGTPSVPGNQGYGILVEEGALYNYIGSYGGNTIAHNALGGIALGRQPFTFEEPHAVYPAYSNWVIYNDIFGAYFPDRPLSGTVYQQPYGVKIAKGSMDNVVQENKINSQYGNAIFLQEAYYNYVLRNRLGSTYTNFAYGIYLMHSRYNWMIENTFGSNGMGPYGINNSPDNAFY